MLSGRRLDLLEPSPLDIEIEDIAHGLARVARWNGQTKGAHAFSVAQHCVLVERLVAELVGRDEEDAHRSRLRAHPASITTSSRAWASRRAASTSAGVSARANRKPR